MSGDFTGGQKFVDTQAYLTEEEMDMIISNTDDVFEKTIIVFLYNTGCRVSEMLGAKTSDINYKRGVIRLRTLKRKGGKIEHRYVPLSTTLKSQIIYYIKWLSKKHGVEEYEGVLFNTCRQNVYFIVRKRAENVGIMSAGTKPVHPHTLRHSFAVRYLKKTKNIRSLQIILGHTDINTTAMYLQFGTGDLQDGIKEAFD